MDLSIAAVARRFRVDQKTAAKAIGCCGAGTESLSDSTGAIVRETEHHDPRG